MPPRIGPATEPTFPIAAAPAMGGVAPKAPDKKKMLMRMTKELVKGLEMVGNIRVDGVTVGVAKDVGPQGGWVVASVRGKYDAKVVQAMLPDSTDSSIASVSTSVSFLASTAEKSALT